MAGEKRSWIRSDEIILKGSTKKLSDIYSYDPSTDKATISKTTSAPDFESTNAGVTLSSHASRHNRGGADPIDYTQVVKPILKSVSPTLGTGGTLGTESAIEPDTNFSRLLPIGIRINIGGTLGTGESITVRITFYFEDGTSNYIDKTYNATGDYSLDEVDFASLLKDGVGITKIGVQAASSATSTSATVTVYVRGFEY